MERANNINSDESEHFGPFLLPEDFPLRDLKDPNLPSLFS
jgi:hypothetical protein